MTGMNLFKRERLCVLLHFDGIARGKWTEICNQIPENKITWEKAES